MLTRIGEVALRQGLHALESDVVTGAWAARYSELLGLEKTDAGYRLATLDLEATPVRTG